MPPLQQYRLELIGNEFLHEWNIFIHQLLLQGDRVGADHRLALCANRVECSGHQIGQGFSDTCPRLHHQVTALLQSRSHRSCHLLLLRTILKTSSPGKLPGLGKHLLYFLLKNGWAAGTKILSDRNHAEMLWPRPPQASLGGWKLSENLTSNP